LSHTIDWIFAIHHPLIIFIFLGPLAMRSAEFDRIMGRALQVKPETTKPKSVKKKTGPKKSPARSK